MNYSNSLQFLKVFKKILKIYKFIVLFFFFNEFKENSIKR